MSDQAPQSANNNTAAAATNTTAAQIMAANPQLAQNPLLNLLLTVILGGSAVGGFFMNNSQWAEVSADLKALRQEMNQITVRLAQFDSKMETIGRLEAADRVLDTEMRDIGGKIMKLEMEVEALKKIPPRAQ